MTTLAWIGWTLGLLATVEYLAHRYLMHRPTLSLFRSTLYRHATQHHRDNNSTNIDMPAWWGLLLMLPVLVLLWVAGAHDGVCVLAVLTAVYCWLWTGLHRAFHGVGGGWTRRLPGYRSLYQHHTRHHECPTRNFGAVFGPVFDVVNGTRWEP